MPAPTDGQPNRSARGFGLVEVMIAAAIMIVIGLAIAQFVKQQSNTMIAFRGVNTRDSTGKRIEASGSNPTALRNSMERPTPENALLKKCLGQANCPGVNGFYLVDAMGSVLAGPQKKPVLYQLDGMRCPTGAVASTRCPISAKTWVETNCIGKTGCQPTSLKVKYLIENAVTSGGAPAKILGLSKLQTLAGEAPEVKISEILKADAKGILCTKPNEVLKGINPDGTPVCWDTVKALGWELIEGKAVLSANPNLSANGVACGYEVDALGKRRMRHVAGSVKCPAGKVPTGGGGDCNAGAGGYLETMRLLPGGAWFVDCCRDSISGSFTPSTIWVYCINDPKANP